MNVTDIIYENRIGYYYKNYTIDLNWIAFVIDKPVMLNTTYGIIDIDYIKGLVDEQLLNFSKFVLNYEWYTLPQIV